MKEYTIRPFTSNGRRILNDDIVLQASSSFTAKEKAQLFFPGAAEYRIIDEEMCGWAGIQREREKSGFGM